MDNKLLNDLEQKSPCNEIINDIEDLISVHDITPKERYNNRKTVKVKAKKNSVKVLFVISNKTGRTITVCFRKNRRSLHQFLATYQEPKQFT